MQKRLDNNKINSVVSARNKKIGIFWLVGPIVMLLAILVIYAIIRFFFRDYPDDSTAIQIINVILGFLGIVFTFLIMIGIPLGIVYLNKKDYVDVEFDPRSGKGKLSEIPAEIKGWSWGAFGFTWIWGLINNVYLSLLVFIPYFSIIWMIVLGIKGKKWAWQDKQWPNIEEFNRVQKKWDFWGKILFSLQILGIIITIIIAALMASGDNDLSNEENLSPFYRGYSVGYQDAVSSTDFCANCNFIESIDEQQEGYYYGYYDACIYEDLDCELNLPSEVIKEIESNYNAESNSVS